jgi:hypothetical protein
MSEMQCPRCGKQVSELQVIDPALMARISQSGGAEVLPRQVCLDCYSQLAAPAAKSGSVLQGRETAKEQRKLMLWKSRVNFIKKARTLMAEKSFSDAAVQYEKYIKVLEVVFDVPPAGLTPQNFRESARTKELSVVVAVYWDLMRIYDTSPNYGERMKVAAKKLALFLRYTAVYPDIVRKAESFVRTAKNPKIVKGFLKAASEARNGCFIATAAFSSAASPEVVFLQTWRDQVLLQSAPGRFFVHCYYRVSPPIARLLNIFPGLKAPVRAVLRLWIDRALRH